jgi:hypothetical protein
MCDLRSREAEVSPTYAYGFHPMRARVRLGARGHSQIALSGSRSRTPHACGNQMCVAAEITLAVCRRPPPRGWGGCNFESPYLLSRQVHGGLVYGDGKMPPPLFRGDCAPGERRSHIACAWSGEGGRTMRAVKKPSKLRSKTFCGSETVVAYLLSVRRKGSYHAPFLAVRPQIESKVSA